MRAQRVLVDSDLGPLPCKSNTAGRSTHILQRTETRDHRHVYRRIASAGLLTVRCAIRKSRIAHPVAVNCRSKCPSFPRTQSSSILRVEGGSTRGERSGHPSMKMGQFQELLLRCDVAYHTMIEIF